MIIGKLKENQVDSLINARKRCSVMGSVFSCSTINTAKLYIDPEMWKLENEIKLGGSALILIVFPA
ncbi:hypothetical protein [Peribacillus butanolivorans]|uniref:hypothetical protein n=1 Tax=Peribacillus butanolivorans TaxID=421767 RepID=UPI0011453950|nr:hypothetical protein [Peribacillus butanolivorans]